MVREGQDARGHPVQRAWAELARHAEAHPACAVVVEELRQVPEEPGRADAAAHRRLCPDGRELHGAWIAAKAEWLETTRAGRARLGVLGADLDAVLLRAAAWERLPDPERRRAWDLPDVERFRLLEALEAGILAKRRSAGLNAGTETDERAASPESAATRERSYRRPGGVRQRSLAATEVDE